MCSSSKALRANSESNAEDSNRPRASNSPPILKVGTCTPLSTTEILASASRWVPSEITLGQAADLVIASDSDSVIDEQALAETIMGTLACTDKDTKTSLRVLTAAGVVRRSAGDSGARLTVLPGDSAEARRLLTVHLQEQMASLFADYRVDVLEDLVG